MNENTGQFRSAAFGGFHRQDVLDYLERITRENQTQKQALEQALAEEQAARDALQIVQDILAGPGKDHRGAGRGRSPGGCPSGEGQ